jgi:soluble lytic murein transglycosylase-like protein
MRSTKNILVGMSLAAVLCTPAALAAADTPHDNQPKAHASAARVASHRVLLDRAVRLARKEARMRGASVRPGYRAALRTWSNERLRGRIDTLERRIHEMKRWGGLPPVTAAERSKLSRIAQCESGGNPHAVGGGGRYRGLFQFDYGTWESVGGHGDPAQAPAEEQYRRAAILLRQRGTSPWPICGSR